MQMAMCLDAKDTGARDAMSMHTVIVDAMSMDARDAFAIHAMDVGVMDAIAIMDASNHIFD